MPSKYLKTHHSPFAYVPQVAPFSSCFLPRIALLMHYIHPHLEHGSRDGLHGTVPELRVAESSSRSRIPRRRKRLLCSKASRPSLKAHPFFCIETVPRALFSLLKRPERESDHSSPFAVELKHECSYTPLLHSPSRRV